MKVSKFKLKSILFMIGVILLFGFIFSFGKNTTNNNPPKKATFVKAVIREIYYE